VPVPYYTAVVAGRDHDWELVPADLDDLGDAGEVADVVRRVTGGGGGLAIIEHEDDWFAFVRVEGEDDPRVFVSDVDAVAEGHYAGLVADLDEIAAAVPSGDDDLDATDPGDEAPDVADGTAALRDDAVLGPAWGGDAALLEDRGLAADELTSIVEHSPDPGAAVVEVAKRLGFVDLVDVWR